METKVREIKAFIQSVIRQRRKFIREGKSHKNEMLMLKNMEHLDKFMEVYPNTTEIQMAKFFLRNMQKIESLLPGHGSNNYDARQSEFLSIGQQCEDIINPKLIDMETQTKEKTSENLYDVRLLKNNNLNRTIEVSGFLDCLHKEHAELNYSLNSSACCKSHMLFVVVDYGKSKVVEAFDLFANDFDEKFKAFCVNVEQLIS